VPENTQKTLQNILVPVDFSTNSRMALEEAAVLSHKDPAYNEIVALHTYKLPSGFYKTGKTEEEFAAILLGHAQKKLSNFIAETDLSGVSIKERFVFDNEHSVAEVVNKVAHDMGVCLVVIGAKGRTDASALLLGSATEKLITLDTDIPLLVVKDKKATFGLLEMLKHL
jgi:nucleotide-binding universal stress UspA family protein